jgi:hypothetical protein
MTETAVTCASCGKSNDPSATFCVSCGVAMPSSTQTSDGSAPPPPIPPADPPLSRSMPQVQGLGEHPASLTQRGVISSLFDLSFTSLVATKLVRLLYVLAMIWIGITALSYILLGFHLSPGVGIVVLFVIAPVSSLFLLGCTRILLELCIGLFQVMANSNELVAQGRRRSSP